MAPPTQAPARSAWLTLTHLGRLYGVSAVQCGRLLSAAGLRQADGTPTPAALQGGLAHRGHPGGNLLWERNRCGALLEAAGLSQPGRRLLIDQWAELLSALIAGAAAVNVSAQDMAGEIPEDLVPPVNAELRRRGCSFQVQPRAGQVPPQARRNASACRAACSSSSRRRSSSV